MSENRPIDGMTPDEWVIYSKGYDKGLEVGDSLAEQRIIKLITDNDVIGSEWWIALIKRENKTNFETYLEEQLKNPEVKEAFEQGENK